MSHPVLDMVMSSVKPGPTLGSGHYLLENFQPEIQRLMYQGSVFKPLTRRIFAEAGLMPGMRVLDLGSGAGDVAFLAAEMVGNAGEVVGIDRDPGVLEVARRRAVSAGLSNVHFVAGDLLDAPLHGTFDAMVGRFILMYQPDPVGTLQALSARLRPGAVIAFHEADFHQPIAVPALPLILRANGWWIETLEQRGVEHRMGPKLYSTFTAAGLPHPSMVAEIIMSGGAESPVPFILQEVIRSILPSMEQLGIATAAEVDVETLADRIRAEAIAGGGCISSPVFVGAWTRMPGA